MVYIVSNGVISLQLQHRAPIEMLYGTSCLIQTEPKLSEDSALTNGGMSERSMEKSFLTALGFMGSVVLIWRDIRTSVHHITTGDRQRLTWLHHSVKKK